VAAKRQELFAARFFWNARWILEPLTQTFALPITRTSNSSVENRWSSRRGGRMSLGFDRARSLPAA